ncbi:MAG: hypothetical protein ABJC04_09125 [Verrucomicrobiota bacterium]
MEINFNESIKSVTAREAQKQIIPHLRIFETPFQAGTTANPEAIANHPGQSQRMNKPETKEYN